MLSGWTTIMTNAIDILLDEMDPEKNPTMEAFVKWVRLLLETGRDLVNIPKIYSERKLNKLMWQNYAVKIGIEEFRLKFEALKDTLKGTVTGVTDVFHPVGNALDTAKDFGFKSKHENGVSSKTHKAISNIGGASGAIDNAWEKINSYILPFSQTALGIIDLVYMVIACVKYSNVEEKGVFIADMIARASLGMSMALEGPKKVSEDKVYTPLAQAALVYASGGSSIAAATAALKYL